MPVTFSISVMSSTVSVSKRSAEMGSMEDLDGGEELTLPEGVEDLGSVEVVEDLGSVEVVEEEVENGGAAKGDAENEEWENGVAEKVGAAKDGSV